MTTNAYGSAYVESYSKTVGFMRSLRASPQEAEDLAQSAWVKGRKLDQLRNEDSIVGWINTIAINLYRRTTRERDRLQPLPAIAHPPVSSYLAA